MKNTASHTLEKVTGF